MALTCPLFFGIMKEIMQYGVIWMANDVRLPPEIIRAIERVISKGQTASVKLDRGVIKVQRTVVTQEMATEI